MRDDDLGTEEASFPTPVISPVELEIFVATLFKAAGTGLEDYTVTLHDGLHGADGKYEFDASVRFKLQGFEYLVLIEVKHHRNPIKRELVQVLHSKLLSVGGHKAVLVATAQFQRGAIEFARAHGVGLAHIIEGRFVFEIRGDGPEKAPSQTEALELFGLPRFVALSVDLDPAGAARRVPVWDEYPDRIRQLLLGLPPEVNG